MYLEQLQTEGSRFISQGGVHGLIRKELDEAGVLDQLLQLDQKMDSGESKVYLNSRNLVAAIDLNIANQPVSVVVKRFPKPNRIRAFIYSYIVPSKAARSWKIAHYLTSHGMNTPKPLAVLHRSRGLLRESYFLMDHITEARTLLRWRRDPDRSSRDKEEGLKAIASYIRALHDAGVYHKDLTAGNFLMKAKPGNGYEIFLVDLNRARIIKHLSMRQRLKDLARLKVCACKTEKEGEKFWRSGCGLTVTCEKQTLLKLYLGDDELYARYKRMAWIYQAKSLAGFRLRKKIRRMWSIRRDASLSRGKE